MARYRVIGKREVLDHEPGEEFAARLNKVQEARLVAGGHLERVVEKKDSGARDSEKSKNDGHDEQTADEA